MLLRSPGPRCLAALQRDALGRPRARRARSLDGALVIFGGALLLTPGFVTDIFGLLMLMPPTRARRSARSLVRARQPARPSAARRVDRARMRPAARARRRRPAAATAARQDYDVEGTAVDVDRPAALAATGT